MRLLIGLAFACLGTAAAAADAPTEIPLDTVVQLPGVDIGCTGIGQTKADPQWRAFPARVEFANAAREYLSDEAVTVSDSAGQVLASVRCQGPWILIRPAKAGVYRIEGSLTGSSATPRTATFKTPLKGQQRIVLTFPDA